MKAYRYKQLVYIPIYKNAATSHEVLFGKILNWETILTEHIDWSNNLVFSHISHPYHRHLRGTVEFLLKNNLTSVIGDPIFEKFLISGYFDQHTYPLTYMFGDKVNQINWLPIDHPTQFSNFITCAFLKKHGVDIDQDQIPHFNISDTSKKELLNRIKQIAESNDYTNHGLYFLLDDDLCLYNRVLNNIQYFI
jgi:hypothetical protein